MTAASNSHLSNEEREADRKAAWNSGYWDGHELRNKLNPYLKGSVEWKAYENGYEEGWLDS